MSAFIHSCSLIFLFASLLTDNSVLMQDDSKKTDISINMDLNSSQQMQLINEQVLFVQRVCW